MTGFELEETTYRKLSVGFEPPHLLSKLVEPESATQRLTVAISLLPWVCYDQFLVRVAERRCKLNASVTRGSPFVNLKDLRRKNLQCKGPENLKV